jgi:NAD(P)-dependent dehydrogenase (short-subunit alcohol dehydrogenase family)
MNSKRVVVVTGGASGMGLGISKCFAANGHPVAMLDVQDSLLEQESAAIRAAGGKILARRVDVSKRDEIDAAYGEIRQEFGPISIVIANAGINKPQDFATMPFDVWQHMLNVNLNGVFHTVQAAIADMVAQKWGRIVTISSNAGQWGAFEQAHYCASKGGVISLTKALAREFAKHGITANTIPPSLVDTPMARVGEKNGLIPSIEAIAQMIPIPRAGTPEDIAFACEFLCSDKASYITGQEINVNGGIYM